MNFTNARLSLLYLLMISEDVACRDVRTNSVYRGKCENNNGDPIRKKLRQSRNSICLCGSNKKFKKCCFEKPDAVEKPEVR